MVTTAVECFSLARPVASPHSSRYDWKVKSSTTQRTYVPPAGLLFKMERTKIPVLMLASPMDWRGVVPSRGSN